MKKSTTIGMAALMLLTAGSANADWGTAENPGILIDNPEMSNVKCARTSDGGQYLIWADYLKRDGHLTFDLYGQYVDAQGNKMWGEEGKLIDNHMTPSWISFWNIQVTPDDDLVISWADARSEENKGLTEDDYYEAQTPVLYKLTKDGSMPWGEEGVVMDAAKYRFPAQLMSVGSTIYARLYPVEETNPVVLQKIDEFGEFAWTEDKPFGGQLIGSTGTDFIGIYTNTDGVVAMRYNENMEAQWEKPAFLSDRVYGGYDINPYILKSDGRGGMVCSYLVALGDFAHIPMLGYVTSDGETAFCQQVLDTEDGDHLYPVFAVNPEEESIMAMWQMTIAQGVLQGEKYDYFGERAWGDMGLTLATKDSGSGYSYGPIAVEPMDDNKWLICYADEVGWAQSQLYLAILDSEGNAERTIPVGTPGDVQDPKLYMNGNNIELVWKSIGKDYDDDWNETPYGKVMGVRTQIVNSGVSEINADFAEGEDAVYSIDGIRLDEPQKGLNIIRKANGETVKVMVK